LKAEGIMKDYSWSDLNEAAMNIILFAGDARKLICEAIDLVEENQDYTMVETMLEQARELIVKAHGIQTDVIQSTVTDENQRANLLFTHAQDTLMSVQSERMMVKNMIRLFRLSLGEKTNAPDR